MGDVIERGGERKLTFRIKTLIKKAMSPSFLIKSYTHSKMNSLSYTNDDDKLLWKLIKVGMSSTS